jgi:hypothetical protein
MSPMTQFAGLTFDLPPGWSDITNDLPPGSPATLARETGVGAIEFSVSRGEGGPEPVVDGTDLEDMLREFCEQNAIPLSSENIPTAVCRAVGGVSRSEGAVVGVWYLSDGQSVAMVTYFADTADTEAADEELAVAEAIVRTASFADAPRTSA